MNILGLTAVWSEKLTKKTGVRRSGVLLLSLSAASALVMAYSGTRIPVILSVVIMSILFELFIEYTGMISPKYRPILSLVDRMTNKKESEE